jgi:hypothetical protein
MANILITFSGSAYDETTGFTVERAPRFGADQVLVYDDYWLRNHEFFTLNQWLWHRPDDKGRLARGFGWFSWKPLIIMDALDRMAEGDVVMFVDGDTYPIADLRVLYDQCRKDGGIMAFMATGVTQALTNAHWNKRDCMIIMGQDTEEYAQKGTAVARFMLFQKGSWRVRQFLSEWLAYCLNPIAQTFDASTLGPERDGFKQHRTEQAIYTNLVHKYGLKLYREACGFGAKCDQDWDLYPQLFEQRWTGGKHLPTGSRYRNV